MKPRNLMITTALAAVLAAPVAAQESGSAAGAEQGQIGSYSVGEFLDLAVATSDGSEAGQVEAVIEGQDGTQVLVSLDDKTVALPLDAFSMSQDGQRLTIDRNMDELEQMAAYQPSGEMELSEDARMADAMGSGSGQQDTAGTDMAETEELDTTVVEGTEDDVTVVTTDPSAVETDTAGNETETAQGGTGTDGASGDEMAQDETEMAQGETGTDGGQTDTEMAQTGSGSGDQSGAGMAQGETEMAEGETGSDGSQADTEMAQTGSDSGGQQGSMGGQQGDISQFADMTVGDILGMEVVAADGNDVGEIDYIYQGSDGYMAVIGIGGFLGLGEHTVALPLSDFSMNDTGDGLMLQNRTEADLDAMQEVDESDLQELGDDHVISA